MRFISFEQDVMIDYSLLDVGNYKNKAQSEQNRISEVL